MAVNESDRSFDHPLYETLERFPGLDLATTAVDKVLTWGANNSQWIFPMATSCCGIEFMAAAASLVDLDRMGSITRGSPRQSDLMVVAGTITVKMAPRVKRLWDQMPEPKWCIAMGSCAISGDFYRDIYSVIPGIDVAIPVDVYIPGCPPNPEQLMAGMLRLQEKVNLKRAGLWSPPETRPETAKTIEPAIKRLLQSGRDERITAAQLDQAMSLMLPVVDLPPRPAPEPEPTAEAEPAAEPAAPAAAPVAPEGGHHE
jgi:NADH-quinone oxidoreductase subunit B